MSKKVGPMGGNMGEAFDDGAFDGVKKITVAVEESGRNCISYIKVEYENNGKLDTREHGTIRGELKEFSVDYPDEYITSVGGRYDLVKDYYKAVLIKSLIFKTNTGKTSPVLGGTTGTEFMLESKNGGKLLGFFGRSGQALDAIGAYFSSPERVGPFGGNDGAAFDDGIFIGVKKITVAVDKGNDFNYISYIKIEYVKDKKLEIREHGTIRGELKEFSVDYPNEYLASVGGSYGYVLYYESVLITSLIFKTNTGRTSPVLGGATTSGKPEGTEFLLEGKNGGKLLGFFGRSGQALDAIGAYF